jgi:hypothetical protein
LRATGVADIDLLHITALQEIRTRMRYALMMQIRIAQLLEIPANRAAMSE